MATAWVFPLLEWRRKPWFWTAAGLMAVWSFLAVWGLTLAGRSFPSDTLRNPLIEYALPNWIEGNIARNAGTVLRLRGVSSLLLLAVLYFILGIGFVWAVQKDKAAPVKTQESVSE
jgi:quinol-cytochrome oxidoreductase complex cytochrome b subunit